MMTRTKTFNVETEKGIDVITVKVTSRQKCGAFCGWKCIVNGEEVFRNLYRLTHDKAIETAYIAFVKKFR